MKSIRQTDLLSGDFKDPIREFILNGLYYSINIRSGVLDGSVILLPPEWEVGMMKSGDIIKNRWGGVYEVDLSESENNSVINFKSLDGGENYSWNNQKYNDHKTLFFNKKTNIWENRMGGFYKESSGLKFRFNFTEIVINLPDSLLSGSSKLLGTTIQHKDLKIGQKVIEYNTEWWGFYNSLVCESWRNEFIYSSNLTKKSTYYKVINHNQIIKTVEELVSI